MKHLFNCLFLILALQIANLETYAGSITGSSSACGGTTQEYSAIARNSMQWNFLGYSWTVVGGVFERNGQTSITQSDILKFTENVIWNHDQTGVEAKLICYASYLTGTPSVDTCELEPTITTVTELLTKFTSTSPYGEIQPNGNIIIAPGSKTVSFTATDQGTADEYDWKLLSTRPARYWTSSTPQKSISLSSFEDGVLHAEADNSGSCSSIDSHAQGSIIRKLTTPSWNNTDEIICSNSTYTFSVNSVSYATYYYWEVTGQFEVWNGASYGSSATTSINSILVRAKSTSGSGTISVKAERNADGVVDSETISMDLWNGKFENSTISGTAGVCPDTYYTYTANVEFGDPSDYTYSWSYPSNWLWPSQSDNRLTIKTPISNPDYGTVTATITNECGSANSGITVYPGYCGGYYMMMPNPSTTYIDLDVDPQKTTALAATAENEITLSIVDKMGTPVYSQKVTTLPYRIDTGKFKKGEYIATIVTTSKAAKTKDQRIESIKFIVE